MFQKCKARLRDSKPEASSIRPFGVAKAKSRPAETLEASETPGDVSA
jgi:hypothetical protein